MRHTALSLSILAIISLCTSAAFAQSPPAADKRVDSVDDLTVPQEEIYKGVIPGKRPELPRLEQERQQMKKHNLITWIGFVPEETRTRVFIQVSEGADYQMSTSDDGRQIILTFENTKVENFNLTRFVDASHFDREVTRIDAQRKRNVVTVTITTAAGASPNISRNTDFIYFDFSHTPKQSNMKSNVQSNTPAS